MDSHLMHAKIAQRADEFLHRLFGDRARRAGPDKWRVGTRGSLAVEILHGRLVYFDHERGVGGDAVDLVAQIRDCGLAEALRECAAAVGGEWQPSPNATPPKPFHPVRFVKPRRPLPGIPSEAEAAWNEGVTYLRGGTPKFNDRAIQEVASWRGWPVGFVRTLVKSGLFSMPLFYGHRTRGAFRIYESGDFELADSDGHNAVRTTSRKRDRQRWVGWHARLQDG